MVQEKKLYSPVMVLPLMDLTMLIFHGGTWRSYGEHNDGSCHTEGSTSGALVDNLEVLRDILKVLGCCTYRECPVGCGTATKGSHQGKKSNVSMDPFRSPPCPPPPPGLRTLRGVFFLKARTSDSRRLERKTCKLTFLGKLMIYRGNYKMFDDKLIIFGG